MTTTSQATKVLKDLKASSKAKKAKELCLKVLDGVYKARFVDEKMEKIIRQNKGGAFHLSTLGHELVGVTCGAMLTSGKDWALPYYRDRSFAIGLGCPMDELFGALIARDVPHHSGGRMMPDHFSHQDLRIPVQSSVVGSQFLHAVGVAKSCKLRETDEVVYVSSGEGATSQGDFHEALNFSCIHKLPVIFVVQDNGWAISVPVEEQTAGGSITKIAKGYEGLDVHDIDGCDFTQLSKSMAEAIAKGRSGNGPSLIVAKVPRIGAHSSSDDPKKYKSKESFEKDIEKDPIPRFESWLLDMGLVTEDELHVTKEKVKGEVEESALAGESYPHPDIASAGMRVYKEVEDFQETEHFVKGKENESHVMVDAINLALHEEMERDPGVIVFGQDVARGKGGVFGCTRNLTKTFGDDRCFNTPLAESTIVGTAIGLSFDGFHKVVAEVQFADYFWTGVNQLFNELSSIYYRSNGEWNCPIVLRMPYGGYIQGGPYHSQSIEAFLAHCPGLKIGIPSNASDAKRMLKAAIRDPNPVVILEHKALYRQRVFSARPDTTSESILPFGKAKVIREGSDVTLVCWGMMAFMATEVATTLEKEGVEVEIIDLRSINPIDEEAILKSVEKTGKLLIAHEAAQNAGFGAEIAARVSELGFENLDAPIKRIGGLDCAVPYAKGLEEEVLPMKADLEEAIRDLSEF